MENTEAHARAHYAKLAATSPAAALAYLTKLVSIKLAGVTKAAAAKVKKPPPPRYRTTPWHSPRPLDIARHLPPPRPRRCRHAPVASTSAWSV